MDRHKDEFLATLAHELRNPLAPIRNAAELLQRLGPNASQEQVNACQTILRQTDHMVRLVNDLLDVSRITQGKVMVQRKPVELKAFMHAAVEISTPVIERRKHRLSVSLPEEEIWISGDHVRLCQVIDNLLHNAAKFTPLGGEISVFAARLGDMAVIKIEDNGIGLAAENIHSIFGLFTQAEHLASDVPEGLGIGLSLVKTLVVLRDGKVVASSEGRGKGSTFEVFLPIIEPDTALASAESIEEGNMDPRRILVIDDNLDAADMLSSLLRINGHRVQVCNSGKSALTCAGDFKPEVIFVDIGLPDMSGYEVAVHLRALPGMEDVMLFALTGYGQDKDRQRALDAGFNDHFVKPIDFNKLHLLCKEW